MREIKKMENYFVCSNEKTQSHIISRARVRHYMKIQETKINTTGKPVPVIIRKQKCLSIKKRLEANTPIEMTDTEKIKRYKIQNYYSQWKLQGPQSIHYTMLTDF